MARRQVYDYQTRGNGLFLTITKNGEEIAFLQGDEACELSDALDDCETDDQQEELLSAYDC